MLTVHGLLVEKSRPKGTLAARSAEQEVQRQLRKAAPAAVAVAVVTHLVADHHQEVPLLPHHLTVMNP